MRTGRETRHLFRMRRLHRRTRLLLLLAGWSLTAAADGECSADASADGQQCGSSSSSAESASTGCGCGGAALSRGEVPDAGTEKTAPAATESTAAADGSFAPPPRLLWIEGGDFTMGHDNRSISPDTFKVDGEGPSRRVRVSSFWLSETEVSNAQWAAFVDAANHVSDSERFGWSFVFEGQLTDAASEAATQVVHAAPWWVNVDGAS